MTRVFLTELPEYVRGVYTRLASLPEKEAATVVWLVGDLGAGKTTFVQQFAKEFGVLDDIQSPTYVLMKTYDIPESHAQVGNRWFKRLVHIDAYRLTGAEEFWALKPERFLQDPGALVLVEWPSQVAGALPTPDVSITFSSEKAGEKERYIEVV